MSTRMRRLRFAVEDANLDHNTPHTLEELQAKKTNAAATTSEFEVSTKEHLHFAALQTEEVSSAETVQEQVAVNNAETLNLQIDSSADENLVKDQVDADLGVVKKKTSKKKI